jgi:hypothetical protein
VPPFHSSTHHTKQDPSRSHRYPRRHTNSGARAAPLSNAAVLVGKAGVALASVMDAITKYGEFGQLHVPSLRLVLYTGAVLVAATSLTVESD